MHPLKQQGEPRFPLEADALALLRSAERYEPPPGQKQRVSARLLARGSAGRGRVIRAPLVFAVLLCAAGASAAASGPWIAREVRALVQATHTEAAPAKVAAKARTMTRIAPVAAAAPALAVEAAQPAAAEVAPPAPALEAVRDKRDVREEAARVARTRVSAESEAGSLVFGAMQALRREGQPERAAKLLDDYRRRYPKGALAEEALALSVEAAVQRGDPRAKSLAESYLARFPNGQFRQAAERARALSSP